MIKEPNKERTDKFFMEFVVCPTCKKTKHIDLRKESMEDVRPVGDFLTGIIFGYYVKCNTCNDIVFIPVINEHFKLFDLSKKRKGEMFDE